MPHTVARTTTRHSGLDAIPVSWVAYGPTRCQMWDGLRGGQAVLARTPHTIELLLPQGGVPLHAVLTDIGQGFVDLTIRGCTRAVGALLVGRWYATATMSTVWLERHDGQLVLRFMQPYRGRIRVELSERGRTTWYCNLSW